MDAVCQLDGQPRMHEFNVTAVVESAQSQGNASNLETSTQGVLVDTPNIVSSDSDSIRAQHRALLQARGSKSASTIKRRPDDGSEQYDAQLGKFEGYTVGEFQEFFVRGKPRYPRIRNVGSANTIIGGVSLWQTRGERSSLCSRKFHELQYLCSHNWNETTTGKDEIEGFGRDATVSRTSSLYNPSSSSQIETFYNTTSQSKEISDTGVPYGFQQGGSTDFEKRSSVLFDVSLRQSKAASLLTYLFDSGYLDDESLEIGLIAVTYNQDMKVFGLLETVCRLRGDVKCLTFPNTLPDIPKSRSSFLVFVTVALLAVIVAAYVATNIVGPIRTQGSDLAHLHWDIIIVLFQVGSLVTYFIIIAGMRTGLADKLRYEVYDSLELEGSRWLLTKREGSGEQGIKPWQLEGNNEGMMGLSLLQDTIKAQAFLQSIYYLLQSITIGLMIPRLLQKSSIIPQAGRIIRTLIKSAPYLFDLALAIFAVVAGLAVMASLVVGHREARFSTFHRALMAQLQSMIVAGGTDSLSYASESNIEETRGEWISKVLFAVSAPVLFVFVLLNFIMAIFSDAFAECKTNLQPVHVTYSRGLRKAGEVLKRALQAENANTGTFKTKRSKNRNRVVTYGSLQETFLFEDEQTEPRSQILAKQLIAQLEATRMFIQRTLDGSENQLCFQRRYISDLETYRKRMVERQPAYQT
ncbi:hypothetical protein BSKO_11877 [Bryopsis sp. KO-2023]|nr:hypothetical protein BSKO_11877 [Bryopsis sp. KO-2023]